MTSQAAHIMITLVLGAILWGCGGDPLADADPEVFHATPTYENHIQPLLREYCVACHDGNGQRAGGVELDQYESAFSNRVRNACVSVTPDIIERFGDALRPVPTQASPTPGPCKDWEPFSMPTGAASPMPPHDQVLLARWVETGAPK